MSTDLIRTLSTGLTLGSLKNIVRANEVVMLLLDTSGSMTTRLPNGKRCIDALRESVTEIKAAGTCPMIAFGGPYDAMVRFVDSVPEPDGGTPLHMAIPFAKQFGATRLVVISDGLPDLTEQSMIEARTFGGQIDVVYVGKSDSLFGGGEEFLMQLAAATGGKQFKGNLGDIKQLSGMVIGLLEGPKVAGSTIIVAGDSGATVTAVEPTDADDDDDEDEDDEDEDDDDDE